MVQALAVTANLLFIHKDKVTAHAVKHKTYIQIGDILTNKHGVFNKQEDKIAFLGLNCLFYFVLDKAIGTHFYKDQAFFKWLFDLFLEKTKHFEDRRFWIRSKLRSQNDQNGPNGSKAKPSDEEKSDDMALPQYNTDEDCRLVIEVLRILFNLTLVETKVFKFKLDTFPPQYQRAVVGRAVQLLTIPCEFEPEFDLFLQRAVSAPD